MADEGDVLTDLDNQYTGNGADNRPTAGFIAQYIKDLSVENPNAPASFQWQDAPSIDLQFNIGMNPVSDEVSEVELKINANATCESGAVYMIELVYAGLVGIRNLPDDQAHMFLFAEAPRILFPFARRVIADATRDLGYPAADGRSDRLQRPVHAAPPAEGAGRGRRRPAGRRSLIRHPSGSPGQ